jgi:hypothetical protein
MKRIALLAALALTELTSLTATPPPEPVITPAPAPAEAQDIVLTPTYSTQISGVQRLQWFDQQTFSITNFVGSIPGAAINTAINKPHEAGAHWSGFGERYGVSLSTTLVSNGIEASTGALWGEDPRYHREGPEGTFKSRLKHTLVWTVMAPNRNGELRPAYARYIAFSSSSFISDAWREPSDRDLGPSLTRIGFAFLSRAGSNAFNEWMPDVKRKLFHSRKSYDADRGM